MLLLEGEHLLIELAGVWVIRMVKVGIEAQ